MIPPVLQDGRVTTVRWTRAGELIGRRMWGLCVWWEDGELRLTSIAAPCAWDGPVHRAHLTPGVERPYPGFKEVGSAGVYAFKPEAAEWMDRECRTLGLVTGHVALSGRVVEHELGYRAERAVIRDLRLEPVALHALGSDRAVRAAVAALERRYQVDVAVSEFRLTAIEEPPPPDLVRYYSIMRTARESWILA